MHPVLNLDVGMLSILQRHISQPAAAARRTWLNSKGACQPAASRSHTAAANTPQLCPSHCTAARQRSDSSRIVSAGLPRHGPSCTTAKGLTLQFNFGEHTEPVAMHIVGVIYATDQQAYCVKHCLHR